MGADIPPNSAMSLSTEESLRQMINKHLEDNNYKMDTDLCPNSGQLIRSGVDDAEESSLKDHMNVELPPLGNFGNQE